MALITLRNRIETAIPAHWRLVALIVFIAAWPNPGQAQTQICGVVVGYHNYTCSSPNCQGNFRTIEVQDAFPSYGYQYISYQVGCCVSQVNTWYNTGTQCGYTSRVRASRSLDRSLHLVPAHFVRSGCGWTIVYGPPAFAGARS